MSRITRVTIEKLIDESKQIAHEKQIPLSMVLKVVDIAAYERRTNIIATEYDRYTDEYDFTTAGSN